MDSFASEVARTLWIYDSIGIALGVGWIVLAPLSEKSFGEFSRWVIFLGCLFAGASVVPWTLGPKEHGGFLILRLWVHALTCISFPIACLRALRLFKGHRKTALASATLATLTMTVWLYAHYVEPFQLEVTNERIVPERRPAQSLRIALLADLQTDHIGAFERKVLESLAAQKADLILCAGDWLQIYGKDRKAPKAALDEALQRFEPWPRLGFWSVDGDIDTAAVATHGTRVKALVDQWQEFPEDKIQLLGLSLTNSRKVLTDAQVRRIDGFDGLSIVLGHRPDFALTWIEQACKAPALALAGHTHGGQVSIPFFGPPMTLTQAPRSVAAGELTQAGPAWIRVSRGTGLERGAAPRMRFLCPPEIVVIDIPGREAK